MEVGHNAVKTIWVIKCFPEHKYRTNWQLSNYIPLERIIPPKTGSMISLTTTVMEITHISLSVVAA